MTGMKVSKDGWQAIMLREGFRTVGYPDSRGIPTNGVGHAATGGPPSVWVGQIWTTDQVLSVLANDLSVYEAAVNMTLCVSVTQNEFDALVSLAFNIGIGGFSGSSVLRCVNRGDYLGAADAFLMWEKPPELKTRREGERAQFLRPDGPAPVAEGQQHLMTVQEVQAALKVFDPTITVDGDVGPQTIAAIKLFQRLHNLPVDGIAGPDTQKALSLGPPPSRPLIG